MVTGYAGLRVGMIPALLLLELMSPSRHDMGFLGQHTPFLPPPKEDKGCRLLSSFTVTPWANLSICLPSICDCNPNLQDSSMIKQEEKGKVPLALFRDIFIDR